MASYNGWANRETWLFNLHNGDDSQWITELVNDYGGDIDAIAEYLKNYCDEIYGNEIDNLSIFLQDFIDLSVIDFWEVAEAWVAEYYQEEEEEEEEEEVY